jgi:hypothetical protein
VQETRPGRGDAYVARLSLDLTTLHQATYLGGTEAEDRGEALSVTAGGVFVAGTTQSTDFPGTSGGAQETYGGGSFPGDAYVARLSLDLTTLHQATYLGGSSTDTGDALSVTADGVYLAGDTYSTDFPGTSGGAQETLREYGDAFVTHLSLDLTTLHQATYLGGNGNEGYTYAFSVTADGAYVAGETSSTDFPGTSGGAQETLRGEFDTFIARLSHDLRTLHQATYLGGSEFYELSCSSSGKALAVTADEVYVAGDTSCTDFPGTSGGAQETLRGESSDAFVARLSLDLTTLHQSTYLGGSNLEQWPALVVAADGVYVAGTTESADFPSTSGGAQETLLGWADTFVARLSLDLTTLQQATYLGGREFEGYLSGLAVTAGGVYVAGSTESTDFPGTSGGAQETYGGGGVYTDAFIARFDHSLAAPSTIVASVLPASRSVQVGTTATVFATIINAGSEITRNCGIGIAPSVPASLSFWTTDPQTNAVNGEENQGADIDSSGAQSYLLALTPSQAFPATDIEFQFVCDNTNPAPLIVGVNTLLTSSSTNPIPDVVALAATLTDDGIVNLASTGVFAVATVNVGSSSDTITVSADIGSASLPVSVALCETNPETGACINPTVPTVGPVTTSIAANATPTFAFFVTSTDTVPFDPANNRIFVRFKDAGGVTRGSTSVAVRTL